MPGLLVNGVDAEAAWGFVLSEPPGWADAPEVQEQTVVIPGRIGVRGLRPHTSPARRVLLRGTFLGSTAGAVRSAVDAMKLALEASSVAVVFADFSDRQLYTRREKLTVATSPSGLFLQTGLPAEISLLANDPLFYSLATSNVGGGQALPLGTGVIRPLVSIAGPSADPLTVRLLNRVGAIIGSMVIAAASLNGDTIAIDMDAKTIKKNGVSILSSLTAGDFFSIDPADQANFAAPGPSITASSGAATSSYRRTWR